MVENYSDSKLADSLGVCLHFIKGASLTPDEQTIRDELVAGGGSLSRIATEIIRESATRFYRQQSKDSTVVIAPDLCRQINAAERLERLLETHFLSVCNNPELNDVEEKSTAAICLMQTGHTLSELVHSNELQRAMDGHKDTEFEDIFEHYCQLPENIVPLSEPMSLSIRLPAPLYDAVQAALFFGTGELLYVINAADRKESPIISSKCYNRSTGGIHYPDISDAEYTKRLMNVYGKLKQVGLLESMKSALTGADGGEIVFARGVQGRVAYTFAVHYAPNPDDPTGVMFLHGRLNSVACLGSKDDIGVYQKYLDGCPESICAENEGVENRFLNGKITGVSFRRTSEPKDKPNIVT